MAPQKSRASSVAPYALTLAGALTALLVLTSAGVESHPRITTQILFKQEIAQILQRKCLQCHSDQNVAFPLASYRDARPWAAAMREEVLARRMPPWGAVGGYGHFSNDIRLNQRELDFLVAWADGGAPSGQTLDEEDKAPLFVSPVALWQRGQPDVILTPTAAHSVAANAPAEDVHIDIPTSFKTAQTLRGLAFKPSDRRVVRHASLYEVPATGAPRWLFTWTPWQTDMFLPEGVHYALPVGARLRLDVGYRGTDVAVEERGEVGLYLSPTSQLAASTLVVTAPPIELAAGAPRQRLRAETTLAEATALFAIYPRVSGGVQSVELTAMLPGGMVQPLLWVKDVEAEWHTPYVFTEPVPLPRGARLVLTVYVENSTGSALQAQPHATLLRVPATTTTY